MQAGPPPPPSDEVEDSGEVGIDAEHAVELTDLFGEVLAA
jgi:hypothetical protein